MQWSINKDSGGDDDHQVSSSPLSLNQWVHFVATYDGTNQCLYINGVLVDSATWSGPVSWSTAFIAEGIGGHSGTGQDRFKGIIDDFRIYDAALSADDIALLTGMVAWWRFDEDSGGVAGDSTGNGHTGIVHGAVWTNCTAPVDGGSNALSFSGSSYVDVGSSRALTGIVNEFSISAWIYPTSDNQSRIYIHRAHYRDVQFIWSHSHDQKVRWAINEDSDTDDDHVLISEVLPLNSWTHIIGSYDGSVQRLFINGEQAASSEWVGDVNWGSDFIAEGIGGHSATTSDRFEGLIDEVIICNYSTLPWQNLSPIAALTATPASGVAPLRVILDASDSMDPDGEVAKCEFDPDGDGVVDAVTEGAGEIAFTYDRPGDYVPSVCVYDSQGNTTVTNCGVSVLGSAPTAAISALPSSGPIPLSVSFSATGSTASTYATIVGYEWDVDGDGVFDLAGTNAVATWIYRMPATNTVMLRVTDDAGLSDTAITTVTAVQALSPPTVTLVGSYSDGAAPLTVPFTATASDNGSIVEYRWDFLGDGLIDLVGSSASESYTYTEVGHYTPTVTVIDDTGLSGMGSTTVDIITPALLKTWITTPQHGWHVWGNLVTVHAHAAPGSQVGSVQLQYKLTAGSTWSDLGSAFTPPPNSYKATWDVTGLNDGADYDLRSLATATDGSVVTSVVITVAVDSNAGNGNVGKKETLTNGVHRAEQTCTTQETTVVSISDGTEVKVVSGTALGDTEVYVELRGANTNSVNGAAVGRTSVDRNIDVTFATSEQPKKLIRMVMPYDDDDDDGLVDSTQIDEKSLVACRYDPVAGEWGYALESTVDTKGNRVLVTTHHLSEFGLFGSLNVLSADRGSSLMASPAGFDDNTSPYNLIDGNLVTYWRSETPPPSQAVFVFQFADEDTAVISDFALYNYGEAGIGENRYSRNFEIDVSMNGTDYVVITNAVLLAQENAQQFNVGSITCRYLRLSITNGYDTNAWELAEVETIGTLTYDVDGDLLADRWEIANFNTLDRDGSGDYDDDGLSDSTEQSLETKPGDVDTDDDGVSDYDEVVAGTSPINDNDVLCLTGDLAASAGASLNISWPTTVGRIYYLQVYTSIEAEVTNIFQTTGTGWIRNYSVTNMESPLNFYRITVEQP
ncbi:MAG: PKD domain-containing protein [Spartobacteria bacterium]|nr:PKD domain-containing protein [Spartobacteria bacterium]